MLGNRARDRAVSKMAALVAPPTFTLQAPQRAQVQQGRGSISLPPDLGRSGHGFGVGKRRAAMVGGASRAVGPEPSSWEGWEWPGGLNAGGFEGEFLARAGHAIR